MLAALVVWTGFAAAAAAQQPPSALEPLTFDEAVRRAVERHPTVGQATQAILRAQALLQQASSVFRPYASGTVGTTILNEARQFGDSIVVPRTQSVFNATVSYPLLAAERWARKNQAADQVAVARVSAEETRRQVALNAAQAYLAVFATERQREISLRNRDTAKALSDYAHTRLQAGQGSRLNDVRSSQELATAEGLLQAADLAVVRAQEALGIAVFADGPVDVSGEPTLAAAPPPSSDAWLLQRPDVRLFSTQLQALDRVMSDTWRSWLPTATASFTPQYVTPAGLFEPAKSWRAFFLLQVPIYDGTLGATRKLRIADRESAKLRLDAVKLEARSEVRSAQEAVARGEQIVVTARQAAAGAAEVLRITEVAYRAGATTNIEVVQAQQTARNSETLAALAEDRLRQARLDLLVALGQFPQ
jgi:outer membrane protein TolC